MIDGRLRALRPVLALTTAALVSLVGFKAVATVHWPAYNNSYVPYAATTAGQLVCLAVAFQAALWLRQGKRRGELLAWLSVSGFVTATLALPLGSTRLFLFGITIDPQFRTSYLTRFTDSPALADMTYSGLPPYYPPAWFWVGGRLASLAGWPGWAAYKPYSILSIAVAATGTYVLWSKLVRKDRALLATLAETAVVIVHGSPEPYGAVLALPLPAVLVIAYRALRRGGRGVWGTGVYLGLSALTYTLYAGYAAFAVFLLALSAGWGGDRRVVAKRLAAMAAVSVPVALVSWGPYLLAVLRHGAGADMAPRFMMRNGATLSLPMTWTLISGLCCLTGTLWIIGWFRRNHIAHALGVAVVAVYLVTFASFLLSLEGTTLLAFRLLVPLLAMLSSAGVLAFLLGARVLAVRLRGVGGRRFSVRAIAAGLAAIVAVSYAQSMLNLMVEPFTVANTDTDGDGRRGDGRAPDEGQYYRDVDHAIREFTGKKPDQLEVLTSDYGFLAIYPYWGFQALTPHYANPLAHFEERSEAIKSWAKLANPDDLLAAWRALPWRAPDVILFRRGADGKYLLRLSADIFPNQPNVVREDVAFDPRLFPAGSFATREFGPFVVVMQKSGALGRYP
ncbi:putative transmembrane protein [Segniliparus rotundus DSM 44985]|uniref:Galactan 5-O-arabinofuranosyltransferase n=1 Tax=Segniliparus rotundus (strain ATCC BAA-972 / CDC 1076 / CIP 108378 / DSM 44985 / JCM 13578) TaxID=640132 RepID=D6ZD63_SEGRD|nr:arabinofuranosyltransferase [Segniliparus rotundus]ADG99250.1 putative transmembrane protein [Segniliparus rotundus DSM 44985]